MADTHENGGWRAPDNAKPQGWQVPDHALTEEQLAAQSETAPIGKPEPRLAPTATVADGSWYLPPETLYETPEPDILEEEIAEPTRETGPLETEAFDPSALLPPEPEPEFDPNRSGIMDGIRFDAPVEPPPVVEPPEPEDLSIFDESKSGYIPGIGTAPVATQPILPEPAPEPEDLSTFDPSKSGALPGVGLRDESAFDASRSGQIPGLEIGGGTQEISADPNAVLPGIQAGSAEADAAIALEGGQETAPVTELDIQPIAEASAANVQNPTQMSVDTGALEAQESLMQPSQAQPVVPDKFSDVEKNVAALRDQFVQGKITRQQLQDELRRLMILDDYGRWWMLGLDTNKWYRYDGREWVMDEPPRPQPASAIPTETGIQQVVNPTQPEPQGQVAESFGLASDGTPLPNKVPIQDLGATMVGQGAMNFDATRPSEVPTIPNMAAAPGSLDATVAAQTVPGQAVPDWQTPAEGQGAAIPGAYPPDNKTDVDKPAETKMQGIHPDYSAAFGGYFDRANLQKWGIRAGIVGIVGGLGLAFVVVVGMIIAYFSILSDYRQAITDLRDQAGSFQTTIIYDANENVLAEFNDPREGARTSVPLTEISPWVIHATVATEDETFYENPGFSIYSILRAVYTNLTTGGQGGGASTITQQLTRALVLDAELATQRTSGRKVQEIIVAAEISRQYTKNEILEFYLNEIYYGNRAYGIEAAAQTYFNKSAKDLNIAEAAFLAGLPQSPAFYDPVLNREVALARMDDVLRLMTEANGNGCIQMQHEGYDTAPLCVSQQDLEDTYAVEIALVKTAVFQAPQVEMRYPHFVNYVWQDLEATYSPQVIYSSGFRVYTTLDPAVQDAAQAALDFQLNDGFTPLANNGAVVAMRPSTGEVIAMVGSADFNNEEIDGQVNVAFTLQQPGSTIKPLVYLAAMEGVGNQHWYPGTVIWDVPSDFNGYIPRNYSGNFNGPVSMRYSIGQSLNIPAVKGLAFVTPQRLTELMERLQIRLPGEKPEQAGLPAALGATDVFLFDMVRAYGAFANQGQMVEPYAITRIVDIEGNEVYAANTAPQAVQVISPEHAYLITDILADPSVRFSRELNLPGWRAAGKTGTTNDVRDVWTIGYTTDAVVGVWVGRTDNQPLGAGVTSGNTAAPIWQQVMTAALANISPRDFPRPAGIVDVQVCADSGALFNPATCPSGQAVSEIAAVNEQPPADSFVKSVEVDSFSGFIANANCPDYVETRSFINIDDATAIAWLNNNPTGQAWAAARNIQIPLTTPPTQECQPGQPRPNLAITAPVSGQEVSGLIEIRGSVSVPDFASYQFFVDNLDTPEEDFVALSQYQTQQSAPNSLLGVVELTNLPNGNYTLRLQGQSRSGAKANYDMTILINNVVAQPTPQPTFTTPPLGEVFTPTPTTDPNAGGQIISPTATSQFVPVPPSGQ